MLQGSLLFKRGSNENSNLCSHRCGYRKHGILLIGAHGDSMRFVQIKDQFINIEDVRGFMHKKGAEHEHQRVEIYFKNVEDPFIVKGPKELLKDIIQVIPIANKGE